MVKSKDKRAILIAGPTASGKTAMAVARAKETGGIVVNADSMQVYGVLDRLTARPDAGALAAAPHLLFGHVDPAVRHSTGAWLAEAEKAIQAAEREGLVPIFVGGTGLYFEALTKGFALVPPVPYAVLVEVERSIQALDAKARLALLAEKDPETARRIGVADPQRVARALAVLEATGRTLASFQEENRPSPLSGYGLERIVLMPERGRLRQRIAERFEAMMAQGAVGEVEALLALGLDPELPAMKAIGVREIAAWLDGEIGREEAVERAVTATRQYAKRQSTWFRNRMGDWRLVDPFG